MPHTQTLSQELQQTSTGFPPPLPSYRNDLEAALSPFLSPREENRLYKSRKMLGDKAAGLSDEELSLYLAQLQDLIESWLDAYEKRLLNGITLRQLLQER